MIDSVNIAKKYEDNKQMLDEFFTPRWLVDIMVRLSIMYGFKGGNILEPSFGEGVFFDALNDANIENDINLFGFELYKKSFDIVSEKYKDANLLNYNFEYEFAKNKSNLDRDYAFGDITSDLTNKRINFQKTNFDLIIGNPPYGSHKSKYSHLFNKDAQIRIEGFFMYLSLQKLKKDGLLVFVVNSLWLHNNNMYNKQKDMIMKMADLVDAYRLPNGIFKGENRDTDIATDILVFRKK